MNITININVDNDSFNDPSEINWLMYNVGTNLREWGIDREGEFAVRDSCGNTVGKVVLTKPTP
jgi:hypothetical protein